VRLQRDNPLANYEIQPGNFARPAIAASANTP
jgi:hypothetical protein